MVNDEIYAFCQDKVVKEKIYNNIDVFSYGFVTRDEVRPKIERKGNEYIIRYKCGMGNEGSVDKLEKTFYFSKDMSCKKIIQKTKSYSGKNYIHVITFNYGKKMDYFDDFNEIDQRERLNVNVKNLSAPVDSFNCDIPSGLNFYIRYSNDVNQLYSDDLCTELYGVSLELIKDGYRKNR